MGAFSAPIFIGVNVKIVTTNILSSGVLRSADAICFTSNGILCKDGRLVMGAGVAKAFLNWIGGLDYDAGYAVKENGNICQVILGIETTYKTVIDIVAFPTKHHWRDQSDLELIKRSTHQLVALADELNWKFVYLPPPGCGFGGLDFKKDIEPVLKEILDDRFIITFLPKQ